MIAYNLEDISEEFLKTHRKEILHKIYTSELIAENPDTDSENNEISTSDKIFDEVVNIIDHDTNKFKIDINKSNNLFFKNSNETENANITRIINFINLISQKLKNNPFYYNKFIYTL